MIFGVVSITRTSTPDTDPYAERHTQSDKSAWACAWRGAGPLHAFPLPVAILAGTRGVSSALANAFAAAVVADLVTGFADRGYALLALGVLVLCTDQWANARLSAAHGIERVEARDLGVEIGAAMLVEQFDRAARALSPVTVGLGTVAADTTKLELKLAGRVAGRRAGGAAGLPERGELVGCFRAV